MISYERAAQFEARVDILWIGGDRLPEVLGSMLGLAGIAGELGQTEQDWRVTGFLLELIFERGLFMDRILRRLGAFVLTAFDGFESEGEGLEELKESRI